jgi:hypothetical protein
LIMGMPVDIMDERAVASIVDVPVDVPAGVPVDSKGVQRVVAPSRFADGGQSGGNMPMDTKKSCIETHVPALCRSTKCLKQCKDAGLRRPRTCKRCMNRVGCKGSKASAYAKIYAHKN